MKHKFRDKLVLSFLALLLITVVPVLFLVNRQINVISQRKIEQELRDTREVFQRFQRNLLKSYSDRAETFILTQPEIRAEIASSGVDTESLFESLFSGQGSGDPFSQGGGGGSGNDPFSQSSGGGSDPFSQGGQSGGGGGDPFAQPGQEASARPAGVAEQQGRIRSIVQEVRLFQDSEIFFMTDFQGRLLFSKGARLLEPIVLTELPDVMEALRGREVFSWWRSQDRVLREARVLPDGEEAPTLYQVFIKPVVFANEIKGLIGIGFGTQAEDVRNIIGITRSEIAFLAGGSVYLNSLADVPAAALQDIVAQDAEGEEAPSLRFEVNDETFLALPVRVSGTRGQEVGRIVIYRSESKEQEVFDNLRRILNIIGIAALAAAALLAAFISHSVSRVVRTLSHGVNEVRQGNLETRLEMKSRDEFGELGAAFNEMIDGLREKETIRDTFKRYVSSSVVDELLRNEEGVALGGENKLLTIQFSDIVGFTSLSEPLAPEEVVEFLNRYLSLMTQTIEAEQGVVDKYIGDAVMAFWGAPLSLKDHADHACRAALAQLRQVALLREEWKARGAFKDFSIRIGLHSGPVVVGNIGSDTRMDYTLIGDSVNTASRLEGMNKEYGTSILITQHTVEQLGPGFVTREIDRIRPSGKQDPVNIHELVGERGSAAEALAPVHKTFAEALSLYREHKFKKALPKFESLAEGMGDRPSATFCNRCRDYLAQPPPEDWDGVFVSTSK